MKKCNECLEEKEIELFCRDKSKSDGYRNICKSCRSKKYFENKEFYNLKSKEYYYSNREDIIKKVTIRKSKKYGKRKYLKSRSKNISNDHKLCTKCDSIKNISMFGKDKSKKDGMSSHCNMCRNKYSLDRKKLDIIFRISTSIRSIISKSISRMGYSKKSKTYKILGCDFEEFKKYIESMFKENMNWGNYGEWHLDHRTPISFAKTEDEVYKLNHYTNFQPLWEIDNLSKGNRYIN